MCFAPTTACTCFDIWTCKNGPYMVCFVHFDFEMCFAPQRRALFQHLQLPKVVRTWCVLYILTWKCASRHNGVQFFISPLASWLRTRRFSEPTFWPSGATNHWKNTVFRDFPTFSRICIFFLLTLSLPLFFLLIFLFSLPLPCSAFHLSILSEVWFLNFLRLMTYCRWSGTHVRFMTQLLPCQAGKQFGRNSPGHGIPSPMASSSSAHDSIQWEGEPWRTFTFHVFKLQIDSWRVLHD